MALSLRALLDNILRALQIVVTVFAETIAEIGEAFRSRVSAPARTSLTKRRCVSIGPWDRRHHRSEGAGLLRWVLCSPGNFTKSEGKDILSLMMVLHSEHLGADSGNLL
jgi:hypothetical protein